MADKPKTVKVEAIKPHSYNAVAYEVGDTYDIDEQYVDSVAAQGMAIRVDRVAHAKAEKKAAEESTTAQAKARAAAVPMTTADAPTAAKRSRARAAKAK